MKKSRKVINVNTNMKSEHVSLPKPKALLSQLHDDDEDVFATSLMIDMLPGQKISKYVFSSICS